jgi:putative SOS response-associated peptidase YedK
MCGRYGEDRPPSEVAEHFELSEIPMTPDLGPRFNIAPSQMVPVVRQGEGGRTLAMLKWGLVPSWADAPKVGFKNINARAEGILKSKAFGPAFKKRRCLMPASLFYEWFPGPPKVPHCFRIEGEGQFAFAGLWSQWDKGSDGVPLRTCALITTGANDVVRHTHHRMPVILEPAAYDLWLDPKADPEFLLQALRPYPGPMNDHAVSPYVNNPKHEGPECAAPVD